MFTLTFHTDNSVFDEYGGTETCRILRSIAARIENRGELDGTIFDSNGNRIGEWRLAAPVLN